LGTARKQSKALALQNAFVKVLLVLVDGGRKVSVVLDTAKLDPVPYHPFWEKHPADVVQMLDYDPDEPDLNQH
jgi:hypothetical protein